MTRNMKFRFFFCDVFIGPSSEVHQESYAEPLAGLQRLRAEQTATVERTEAHARQTAVRLFAHLPQGHRADTLRDRVATRGREAQARRSTRRRTRLSVTLTQV